MRVGGGDRKAQVTRQQVQGKPGHPPLLQARRGGAEVVRQLCSLSPPTGQRGGEGGGSEGK